MEEREAKGTRLLKRRAGFSSAREDLISELPDALISEILSYLPTKVAARTSVLSNRWKSLWFLIPGLDLDSFEFQDYNAFVSIVDRLLGFKPCLDKLKLISITKRKRDQPCVTRWIDFVARRKLKHLDVVCFVYGKLLDVMPLSLYICETLLYLRLHHVSLGGFESVSLPRLKTMLLEHNVYANESVLELLISSCPVLEELSVVRCVADNVKVLRVHSQTLTSLSIEYYLFNFTVENLEVLIDAPRLKYLNFEYDQTPNKTISNSGSLTKVNLLGFFHLSHGLENRDMVSDFFTSISGVKHMKISSTTFEFIESIMRLGLLPQFCNLSCLEVELQVWSLGSLPTFLESFPSLKSLILKLNELRKNDQIILSSSVPECLRSSLEFIEIKTEISGVEAETKLIKYFLENSEVLKKFTLRLGCRRGNEESTVLMELLRLRRCSASCEVFCLT